VILSGKRRRRSGGRVKAEPVAEPEVIPHGRAERGLQQLDCLLAICWLVAGGQQAGQVGRAFVVESWTSREAQAEFMQNRLGPAMAQGGVTATPKVTWATLIGEHHPGE
jgi:hypothetical protein